MDGSTRGQDGNSPFSRDHSTPLPNIVTITPQGDVVLDVVFETSKETLKAVRKATQPRPSRRSGNVPRPVLAPKLRVAYCVQVETLKKQSKYFNNLLGDTRFKEAKTIAAAFRDMSLKNLKAAELQPADLPWIRIEDDDEATRYADREIVFAELMRILHGKETVKNAKSPPTMLHLTILAILADRFDCTSRASTWLRNLRYQFPQPIVKTCQEDGNPAALANEEAIRQKILTSWLLDQPLKFHAGSRELILYGSRRWSPYVEADGFHDAAAWWDLPDDLESKQDVSPPLSSGIVLTAFKES
jgi:hypothetical protein